MPHDVATQVLHLYRTAAHWHCLQVLVYHYHMVDYIYDDTLSHGEETPNFYGKMTVGQGGEVGVHFEWTN